ncbi:MAG: site-2 protease family protein, partial [Phycisphaerales bacterium]|nr:site-2 protease family protein [Phycisphaerales bacterium]
KTIALKVRRDHAKNNNLSAGAVDWLIAQRESLIASAIANFDAARASLGGLIDASGLDEKDRSAIVSALNPLEDASGWRKWLENADVHELTLAVPTGSILGGATPKVQVKLQPADESVVYVADTIPNFGAAPTPARKAGIPRDSVILKVNDRAIDAWHTFYWTLRANAGKTISLTYRHLDTIETVQMPIPDCVEAQLNLLRGDRITKIGGETDVELVTKDADGKETRQRAILPDWRAIDALLRKHVGETVDIEYAKLTGEKGTGQYAVTADNIDPWLDRAHCSVMVEFYPMSERHPIRNPIKAFVAGCDQAYRATVDTIVTIKQLVTRNVGTKNMSGPLGIMAIGAKVANHSTLDLLWLLGLLSANLAVINFLPLPIVDGGLFLFLILEKIRGEPVSIKVQVATQIVGIALIATVFILVTAQDLLKLIS